MAKTTAKKKMKAAKPKTKPEKKAAAQTAPAKSEPPKAMVTVYIMGKAHKVPADATITVAYDDECAGGAAFTKTFTGQVVMANKASRFLAGGDSGCTHRDPERPDAGHRQRAFAEH